MKIFLTILSVFSISSVFACTEWTKELRLDSNQIGCEQFVKSGNLIFLHCPNDGISTVKDASGRIRHIYLQDDVYISRSEGHDFTNDRILIDFLKYDLENQKFSAEFRIGDKLTKCKGDIF